mmetsp:Transcript_950/g.2544  ORF Transcript_950/g.2544 Transcript_950/m.2544 type:complete len:176 (+) Transcript_950:1814-2341(+)
MLASHTCDPLSWPTPSLVLVGSPWCWGTLARLHNKLSSRLKHNTSSSSIRRKQCCSSDCLVRSSTRSNWLRSCSSNSNSSSNSSGSGLGVGPSCGAGSAGTGGAGSRNSGGTGSGAVSSGGGGEEVLLRRWTLGEVVSAAAECGLVVESLTEEPSVKADDRGLPKSFTLVARRKG